MIWEYFSSHFTTVSIANSRVMLSHPFHTKLDIPQQYIDLYRDFTLFYATVFVLFLYCFGFYQAWLIKSALIYFLMLTIVSSV